MVMLINLCAEIIQTVFDGDKNLTVVEGMHQVIMYQAYPVSRITGIYIHLIGTMPLGGTTRSYATQRLSEVVMRMN